MGRPTTDALVLHGRYRLLDRLGAGGMGTVHLAHDELLDRDVAVKVLHGDATDDDLHRARLQAEARFASSLRHPSIVQVYDYGEAPRADGGATPYVVMEHVPGPSLSAVLRERGPLPPEQVALLLAGVADALATAHAAGIVHRDLKPSNILLAPSGAPVIVDFGIARSDDTEPLTRTGEIIGTADYLSPEQVRGQRATAASDVYALGVVAYQCLTATSPFHRETHVATALAHLNDPAPALPHTVPSALRSLVPAMLADDPGDRPDATEVARRASSSEPSTTVTDPQPERARLPRPLAVACAAAVVLAGALVYAATTDEPAAPPAAAELAVPSVRGEELRAARSELRAAGFEVAVRRVDGPRGAGHVLGQAPAPGRYDGSEPPTVTLRVASGQVDLDAGELVGESYDTAAARLSALGLTAARTDEESTAVPVGQVVASSADGRVPTGSVVTLTVAVAPDPVVAVGPAESTGTQHHKPGKPGKAGKDPKPGKGHGPKPGKGHGPKKHRP